MLTTISRCLLSLAFAVPTFPIAAQAQCRTMKAELTDYVRTRDAKIGIAVITDRHDTICVNNEHPYPMNSVMKLYQAMAVVDMMQQRGHKVDSVFTFDRDEMDEKTYSPMRDTFQKRKTETSVAELLKYSLQQSDNNACDMLFRHVVGVHDTDKYIRRLGFKDFAIAASEADMHADTTRVHTNWSYPLTAAMLINRLFTERLYNAEYQHFLIKTLNECSTGVNRLAKPLLTSGATIGHKTGTGFTSPEGYPQGINDVGFVRLPDGRSYSVAVFVETSRYDMEQTEQMIADISGIVLRNVKNN